MATKLSREDQRFADVVDRVLTDSAFAKKLERDPATTLTAAGFKLTAAQRKAIISPKGPDFEALKLPTKPLVRIVTKGTKPVVQVVVNSVVVKKESTAPEPSATKRTAAKRRR